MKKQDESPAFFMSCPSAFFSSYPSSKKLSFKSRLDLYTRPVYFLFFTIMLQVTDTWYRTSVKAIVFDEKWDVLLCKEADGRRDLPGGGLDRGENPLTCLERELQEEMWLQSRSIQQRPLCFVALGKPTSQKRPWVANVCYEVELESLDFVPSDECVEIGFFNPKTSADLQLIENVSYVFKELFSR